MPEETNTMKPTDGSAGEPPAVAPHNPGGLQLLNDGGQPKDGDTKTDGDIAADVGGGAGGTPADRSPVWIFGMSRSELGFLLAVLLAGMVGAWCAKVIGKEIMVYQHNGELATPVGWLGVGFIGAIAAGLGVYLLANSDTNDRARTLFFAVGCGLCGQIIIGKTITTIEDSVGAKGRSASAQQALVTLKESISRDTNANKDDASRSAHDWLITLIERARVAENNGDFELAAQYEQQAGELLTSIMIRIDDDPLGVVEEIRRVIKWAHDRDAIRVKKTGLESLKRITISDEHPDYLEAEDLREEVLKNPGQLSAEPADEEAPAPTNAGAISDTPQPALAGDDAVPWSAIHLCQSGGGEDAQATAFLGRVYLEIDRDSMADAAAIAEKLPALKGYKFIKPKTADSPDYKECRVLYYRAEDKEGAEKLYKVLEGIVGANAIGEKKGIKQVPGVKGARPKHFDLRLGRDIMKMLKEKATAPAAGGGTAPPPIPAA